jgi:hypothetical protein
MIGDNNFKWYWGRGSEPDVYWGGEDSREAIIEVARDDVDGESFTIIEADKSIPTFNVFDADNVLDSYVDHNEECWGEDGPDFDATLVAKNELELALANVLQEWMRKHSLIKTWSFGTSRNQESFPEEKSE